MRLRSFKLSLRERRVRIVPSTDAAGCPFSGPGVDLGGEAADRAIELALPAIKALASIEPGISVRSISIDIERARLLATLHPTTPDADPRPRAVHLDDGAALRGVLRAAEGLIGYLSQEAGEALARRKE